MRFDIEIDFDDLERKLKDPELFMNVVEDNVRADLDEIVKKAKGECKDLDLAQKIFYTLKKEGQKGEEFTFSIQFGPGDADPYILSAYEALRNDFNELTISLMEAAIANSKEK